MLNSLHHLPSWKSILFIPANNEKFIHNAHKREADAVLLDMEDAVPLAEKETVRSHLTKSIELLADKDVDILIRINRDLLNCLSDLQVAVHRHVKAVVVPKVIGAEHIKLLDETIKQLEINSGLPTGQIKMIALIENLQAIAELDAIAQACPRLIGLALGSEDLSLDLGIEPTTDNLIYPAQKIIYAARCAHIKAYGFPGSIASFSNDEENEQLIRRAKSMGFDGAFCIHPKQVLIINQVYQVTNVERVYAKRIVSAYHQALKNNQAVIEIDGKMIDLPVVQRAMALLEKQN